MADLISPAGIDDRATTRDVTSDLNNWAAHLPAGAWARLREGRYRVDGTFTLDRKPGLLLDARGATFRATTDGREAKNPRTRAHVRLSRCTDTALFGLAVVGAHPNGGLADDAYVVDLEAQHAFEILGGRNVQLHRVSGSDIYGDVVYVGGPAIAEDVLLADVWGARTGRQGISICHARGWRVVRPVIWDIRRSSWDLEPAADHWIVENGELVDGVWGAHRGVWGAAQGLGTVNDVLIARNWCVGDDIRIDENESETVRYPSGRRSDWKVLDNVSTYESYGTSDGCVMKFYDVDRIEVARNVQVMQDRAGVEVFAKFIGCTDFDQHDNTIR